MYTLTKAYQHDRQVKNKWVEVKDLATLLGTDVERINGLYGPVQLILTHNTEPEKNLRYDFLDKRREFKGPLPATLGQWLTAAAGINLSTTVFTGFMDGRVYYADVLEAKWDIHPTIPNGLPNPRHTDVTKSDLLLTPPSHLLPELVLNNCLHTVAGYLHRSYATTNGVYLRDGGATLNRSGMNTSGIISFSAVGSLKTYGITEDMLSALPEHGERQRRLSQPVYLKAPSYDPSKQTAFLSLMGVLLPLGKTFREVGDGLFEINLVQYDYLQTYMRAERILGFKDVKAKIETSKRAPTQISLYDARSRDFLLGILTCSQTFLIVVDTPGVYFEKIPMETTQNPMVFMHHSTIDGPVIDGQGVLLDYLINKDLDVFTIDTPPTDLVNRRMHTAPFEYGDSVDSLPRHDKPLRRNTAYMLRIGKQTFK